MFKMFILSRDRERTKKWKPVSDPLCVVRSIYKPFDHLGKEIKIEYSHVILQQTFILHRRYKLNIVVERLL